MARVSLNDTGAEVESFIDRFHLLSNLRYRGFMTSEVC
jgi:hypothetical protein